MAETVCVIKPPAAFLDDRVVVTFGTDRLGFLKLGSKRRTERSITGEETIRATLARAHTLTPNLPQGHRTGKDLAASIGRWRTDLDDKLKAECKETFGDVFEQFGYEP